MLMPLLLFLQARYYIWKLTFGLLEQNDSCNPFSKAISTFDKVLVLLSLEETGHKGVEFGKGEGCNFLREGPIEFPGKK